MTNPHKITFLTNYHPICNRSALFYNYAPEKLHFHLINTDFFDGFSQGVAEVL